MRNDAMNDKFAIEQLLKYHRRMEKINNEILREPALKRLHRKAKADAKQHKRWIEIVKKQIS